jgi:PAS domain S-box-containing protein
MGVAIAAMHYTAMTSVKFQRLYESNLTLAQLDNSTLAVSIGVATLILALAFISTAIAQRITAENAKTEFLRQSEARFRALEQNSSDITQVVNAVGCITYTSCSMQRILGYTPEDCQEKQAFTLVYQADLVSAQKLLQEALSHPAANIVAEFRLQHASGEPRDFEAIACNLLAEPSVNGVVITYRDISKRKQTESALWNALQRLTFHVENSPLAVIEWNRDFRVARWSREAEMLFGWQAAEVLGKLPSEWNFIFPEDQATVSQVIEQLIDGTQQRNVSLNRNYTKNGKVVYCEWYNSGLLDESGNLVSVMSLILDVTQQKQTEAELVHRAAELVRLTAVLAQTNYDLQKRNQELDEFTYVVSHDLKAPLRAIANLSEWIEEDLGESLTEETCQQMNLLRGRVYRMEALINGLLQYSRVGRVEVPMTSVSVATLLAEVIDSLDPPATFTIKVSAMPTLWTYGLLLEQVFSNLISNAIKHHPRLDGKIHVSSMDIGDFYQFTVADDGDGIVPKYQAKVFGIFQTLSARDQKENTGIGLSIVKKIVESQGGRIWLESQAGQGAAFHFTWLKNQE